MFLRIELILIVIASVESPRFVRLAMMESERPFTATIVSPLTSELLLTCWWDQSFLLISAYRYAARTISSSGLDALRLVSEAPDSKSVFLLRCLLIVRTHQIVTLRYCGILGVSSIQQGSHLTIPSKWT